MFLGRQAECARIDQLLAEARRGTSGALVVRGEPGIGKTALLHYAIEAAERMRVLRTRGAESESEIPFAGLSDLLRPVLGYLPAIPPPQAGALAAALAIGPPASADRFAVCAGTLSLLSAAAEESPLLVVADDAHWLDAPSLEALLFTARRLDAEGVVLLLAMRREESADTDLTGLELMDLAGLGPDAARQLLASSGGPMPISVARRLVEATQGNPLGLLEIPAMLDDLQLAGARPFGDPIPVGSRLDRALHRQISRLPDQTRRALLVAAASDSGAMEVVAPAVLALGLDLAAFEPAERAGLVCIDDLRVEFRHPLLRSAAYHGASTTARSAAHRALAEMLARVPGDRAADERAWHLARAAFSPDEEVAVALEAAGSRARMRAGYATAAAAFERASRLTPDDPRRARRLLLGAEANRLAGCPAQAGRLLDEALPLAGDPLVRAEIQHLRGHVQMWRNAPSAAHRLLVEEAERVQPHDPAKAALMLADAAMPCFMNAEARPALETAERAFAIGEGAGDAARMTTGMLLAVAQVLIGEGDRAQSLLRRCQDWIDQGDPLSDAQAAVLFANALMWREEFALAARVLARTIDAARHASALGVLPFALATLSDLQFRTGEWAGAYASAGESVRLADETRQANSYSLVCLARIEAAMGREDECRAHVARARDLARSIGVGSMPTYTGAVLGLLALGLGRTAEAVAELEHVAAAVEVNEVLEPAAVQWAPDLIEAYARAGRLDEAENALAAFARRVSHSGGTWAAASLARGRGLVGGDDQVDAHFLEALELHRKAASPFDLARTELCFGEALRRRKRRIEARDRLRAALQLFEQLGAVPWAERARNELRATGETARRRDPSAAQQLTSQELQVALVVARGLTNQQAAAALFLSPKTIEFHLSHVYRKLNIRSRSELTSLLLEEAALARVS